MSIQATVSTPPVLNHYLTEIPEKNASELGRKAFTTNVIAKITYAAIVAICATVLAISLFAASASGVLPFILLGLALSTPFLAMGAAKLQGLSINYSYKAEVEKGVAEELKNIQGWKTAEIKEFYQQHGLPLEHLPIEELMKLDEKEPLCALLPLIARFQYLNKKALEHEERFKANLVFKSDVLQLRVDARKNAILKHESEAIPHMIDAAVILQILAQPALQLTRDDLGYIKDFQERSFDRLLTKNDDFFLFHDAKRPPLKLSEIENNLNPDALRQVLFAPLFLTAQA